MFILKRGDPLERRHRMRNRLPNDLSGQLSKVQKTAHPVIIGAAA